MHFKRIKEDGPGLHGEFGIEDLIIFSDTDALKQAAKMWNAVVKYSLTVDRVHAEAITGLQQHLAKYANAPAPDEDALDDIFMAEMEFAAFSDSNSYLVKSLIFLLLVSFNEFALKQIYRLIRPSGPPYPPRGAVTFIINALRSERLIDAHHPDYESKFLRHIDAVRNNFAHGDWAALGSTLSGVDLTNSFVAVAAYFYSIQQRLSQRGYNT